MCTDLCGWLHKELSSLQEIKYPFDLQSLPTTGIYFFYEIGEIGKGHDDKPRIVRIGTAGVGNFKNRIASHFLFNEEKMKFTVDQPKPADMSIFRKNIGRALLKKNKSDYLKVWNIDFILKQNRERYMQMRDIEKEIKIEQQVTNLLRKEFRFRYLVFRENPFQMEAKIISTVNRCKFCSPSPEWFGIFSPKPNIQKSGLWQEQHLKGGILEKEDIHILKDCIKETKKFLERK